MDLSIALSNLDTIRNLPPHTRLTVNSRGELSYDQRYLQGIRRLWWQESRDDLTLPIMETFQRCRKQLQINEEVLMKAFEHLKERLFELYPDNNQFIMILERALFSTADSREKDEPMEEEQFESFSDESDEDNAQESTPRQEEYVTTIFPDGDVLIEVSHLDEVVDIPERGGILDDLIEEDFCLKDTFDWVRGKVSHWFLE